jgi:hypothetical protein
LDTRRTHANRGGEEVRLLFRIVLVAIAFVAGAAPSILLAQVKVYAWHPAEDPRIVPMVWVRPFQPYGQDADTDPVSAARRVALAMRDRVEGDRVLFVAHALPRVDRSDLRKIVTSGAPTDWTRYRTELPAVRFNQIRRYLDDPTSYHREFAEHLRRANVHLDLVVADEEDGWSTWHTPQPERAERFQDLFSGPRAVAALPPEVRRHAQLDWGQIHRQAYIDWNQWSTLQYHQHLYDSLMVPLNNALGKTVPFSQYQAYRMIEEGVSTDFNTWPLYTSATFDVSSPALYPDGQGNAFHGMGDAAARDKHLQLCLAQIGNTRDRRIPWVPYPSYIGKEQFRQLIEGCHRLGVREFLYWNPNHTLAEDDNAFASEVFAALNRRSSR